MISSDSTESCCSKYALTPLVFDGLICCDTGYVLSCLPFMSEECLKIHEQIELIKNLKLAPDFIINIKVIITSSL